MDHQLLSFELSTEGPELLKEFLSEVLAAEIMPGEGLFAAELGGLKLDVVQGATAPRRLTLALSPEAFADILPRWEFYCFRHERRPTLERSSAERLIFSLPEGMVWTLIPHTLSARYEDSIVTVRNC